MLQGWPQIVSTEPALTTRLELVPNLVAAKVARRFVARACLDWHLGSRRPAAVAIVSEPSDRTPRPGDHGRPGRRLVHNLADLTGTLPTREGDTLVWAILGPR